MPIFLIAVAVVLLSLFLGIFLAQGVARLDTVVKDAYESFENKDEGFNPAATLGHRIKVQAGLTTQLKEARALAAEKAAALPRGANMKIGRLGNSNLSTAWQRIDKDPLTAVRIAAHHGWDGARTGIVAAAPVAAAPPTAAATGKVDLAPGKDYPVIEIRDDMSPDEKRKARIANAKAKSEAMKAAKEVAQTAPAAATSPVATVATPATMPGAAPIGAPEPPQLIEITDDMSADEIRKARIANSKAKSAYNKALKAAGQRTDVAAGAPAPDVAEAVAAGTTAPATTAATSATEATSAVGSANIPPPDLIEITDDMSPDEIRRARIANSKAKSAYNKALKAAGVDPSSVS